MTASLAWGIRLFDKTKVEAKHEQDEMNDGAEPADFASGVTATLSFSARSIETPTAITHDACSKTMRPKP
jgi:hypothetical protein